MSQEAMEELDMKREFRDLYNDCCYEPTSRFKEIVYNLVDPEVARTHNPPAGIPKEQLDRNNPDPRRMIPVVAFGGDQLTERKEKQRATVSKMQAAVERLAEVVLDMKADVQRSRTALAEARARHTSIQERLLTLMARLEVLRAGASRQTSQELHFHAHLAALQREMNAPTQYKARVTELASVLRVRDTPGASGRHAALTDTEKDQLFQLLQQQQRGLKELVDVLRRDMETVEIMQQHTRVLSSFS